MAAEKEDGYKALAFQEPWATLIASGIKTNEYRSRRVKTPVRDLVVCASKSATQFYPIPGLCYGKAVGLVDIVACEEDGEGGWVWRLENPRMIKPFDVRASASFFYVHDEPVVIETSVKSYRENVLPHAFQEAEFEEDIDSVIEACIADKELLLEFLGEDITNWL